MSKRLINNVVQLFETVKNGIVRLETAEQGEFLTILQAM